MARIQPDQRVGGDAWLAAGDLPTSFKVLRGSMFLCLCTQVLCL